jgi:hypothetical protein
MHHELGWQRTPPPFLLIACLRPAASGGRTGVADGRTVLAMLPGLAERAERVGWALVRRYGLRLVGMRWQDAFCGWKAAEVVAYAAAEAIDLDWDGDWLVTNRLRPAIRPTGPDGEPAWSNLLAFCSEWTLDPGVREYLVSTLGGQALPFETAFGDGTPFTAKDVAATTSAYDRATAHVAWAPGQVLMLDNVRTAHSTEPYVGDRRMALLHAALDAGDGR